MKALAPILTVCIYAVAAFLWVAGAATFLWSILLAYLAKGFLGAAAMIVFPIASQLFLAFVCWPSDYSTLTVSVFAAVFLMGFLRIAAESIAPESPA